MIIAASQTHELVAMLHGLTDEVWQKIKPMVETALKDCDEEATVEDVRGLTYFLVRKITDPMEVELVIGADRVLYPRFEVMRLNIVAGRALAFPWATDALFQWAKDSGARFIEGVGKPSVARLWKRAFNARANVFLMRKEL